MSDAFDAYAEEYDEALNRGLALSGESKDYFAQARIRWLARRLRDLGEQAGRVMDYGCGTGTATNYILDLLRAASVTGVDVSTSCLAVARRYRGGLHARYVTVDETVPEGAFDLVFSNGSFHHILPDDRPGALKYVHRALRPGGLFALWENNAWSPAARLVMSRIPFDRDAVPLSARQAVRLVERAGFHVLFTDHQFVFPRALQRLRALEVWLASLPLGAQFQVLCRKI